MNPSDSTPHNTHEVVNDETYYLDDDPMVIFLVENRRFKIHRHFLTQGSKLFRDMFTVPSGIETTSNSEGLSNEHPIVLPAVTIAEFKVLLNYLYLPRHVPMPVEGTQHHLDLLSISHRFQFDEIYQHTLPKIKPTTVPIIKRLELGEKYALKSWCFSAYEELVERKEMISATEAQALGQSRILKLAYAREDLLRDRVKALEENVRILTLKSTMQSSMSPTPSFSFAFGSPSLPPPSLPPAPSSESIKILVEKHFFPK